MKFSQLVFQSNIIDLKSYLRKAPESNKARINEVIKLYEDKKIKNIKTALTTVASLASTNKNTINSGKPSRLYEQVIEKYRDALPMTGQRTHGRQDTQQSEPIRPPRRRGRPTKQEQQTQRLEQHRLLREEQQRELRAQVEEYGQGDLFIDDEEPQVPEWVRSVERERRNKQSKKRTKKTGTNTQLKKREIK